MSGGLSPRFHLAMLEANIEAVCGQHGMDAMAEKSKQRKKSVKKLPKKLIKKAKKEAKKEGKKSDTDVDRSDVKPPSPFSS
jgi:hypothetical protein